MLRLKKITRVMALALALTLTVPAGVPMSQTTVAEAATIKLNVKKKSLKVGKTYTLKVSGTKKKVTWSSDKKSVAIVNSKGKVTAKKVGTATITAKVAGKKLTCKITVTNPVNKYVAKAPFEAKEIKLGKFTAAAPKDWEMTSGTKDGISEYVLTEPGVKLDEATSIIDVIVMKNENATQDNFDIWKATLEEANSKEIAEANLIAKNGTLEEYAFEEVNFDLGKVVKITVVGNYEQDFVTMGLRQIVYVIPVNEYIVQITGIDSEGTTPDLFEATEYMMQSLIYNK